MPYCADLPKPNCLGEALNSSWRGPKLNQLKSLVNLKKTTKNLQQQTQTTINRVNNNVAPDSAG